MKKPEPITKHIVCSVCGLDWDKHGEKPTLETCIELLKAENARPRQPLYVGTSGTSYPLNVTATNVLPPPNPKPPLN